MARLLTLQLLYHFGYAVGCFISLERILRSRRRAITKTWRQAREVGTRPHILKRTLPFAISEIEEACPGVSRDMDIGWPGK